MAEFRKGFTQDTEIGVTKAITQTVTGLAETALGDVNQWRTVLAANPSSLPFSLPPTLQQDIDRINAAVPFPGLKIPPASQLDTDLKKALGDLANPVLLKVNSSIDGILGQAQSGLEKLKQIDWLGIVAIAVSVSSLYQA